MARRVVRVPASRRCCARLARVCAVPCCRACAVQRHRGKARRTPHAGSRPIACLCGNPQSARRARAARRGEPARAQGPGGRRQRIPAGRRRRQRLQRRGQARRSTARSRARRTQHTHTHPPLCVSRGHAGAAPFARRGVRARGAAAGVAARCGGALGLDAVVLLRCLPAASAAPRAPVPLRLPLGACTLAHACRELLCWALLSCNRRLLATQQACSLPSPRRTPWPLGAGAARAACLSCPQEPSRRSCNLSGGLSGRAAQGRWSCRA
jgi:hypothetical protein